MALTGVTEDKLRRLGETTCVKPSLDGFGPADFGAGQVGVVTRARVQLGCGDRDYQRRSAADSGDSVDLPAADDEIQRARDGAQEFLALDERQFVNIARRKDVRNIRRFPGAHTAIDAVVVRPKQVRVVNRLR